MKGMIWLLLLAMFVVVGCESDNPTENDNNGEPEYSFYFENDYEYLYGLAGDTVDYDVKMKVFIGEKGDWVKAPGVNAIIETWENNDLQTTRTAVSDEEGVVEITLSFVMSKGSREVSIVGRIGDERTWGYVQLEGYNRPARMLLTGGTHTMIAPRGVLARMKINGLVVDEQGVGIRNIIINGYLEREGGSPFGAVSYDRQTNSAGNFDVFYSSTGGFGVEDIVITSELYGLPETRLEQRYRIEVLPLEDQIGTLSLYALPAQVVLPSGGESVLTLNALVLNRSGEPISGVTVNFASAKGVIQTDALTDSVGFAKVLWHTGVETGDALITAFIVGTDFETTGNIELVRSENTYEPPSRISLFSDDLTLIAGSEGSTTLRAICQTASGTFARPGTIVGFEIIDGTGRFEVDHAVVDEEGEAAVRFIVGQALGTTHIRAFVETGVDERVESNDITIRAIAGEAENLAWDFEEEAVELGGSTVLSVAVTDRYGNPVEGEVIRFSSTLGIINPLLVTDGEGRGEAYLTAGVTAGVAEITIAWNGRTTIVTVTFIAATPNSIELSANPLSIHPSGATSVMAKVFDFNGNPVSMTTTVVVELINQPDPPEGCSFPNGTHIDSTQSANGISMIMLSAGTQTGGVLLKAYTWRDEARTDTISAMLGTIQVISGPPASLALDIDNRGVDAGGGIWNLPVTIWAYDASSNPASGEYPVTLSIQPEGIATITPARLIDGRATATLSYPSSSTFSPCEVTASIVVPNRTLSAELQLGLPLQRGFLSLAVDPANWLFDRQRPDDTCLVRVWATLRDGHDEVINNAPILFTTDRARYFWRNQVGGRYTMFFPEPARKYTGVQNQNHNELPGVATVYLRGKMADFYLDDFTLEVTVQLGAHVDGTDIYADPVRFFCTRH